MKKTISILLTLLFMMPSVACGSTTEYNAETTSTGRRIMIAYFTRADNTVVKPLAPVDVDATTSASLIVPGNTARMAMCIQKEVGGELFSIIVTELYSSDYDECLERATDEKTDHARPALRDHIGNMEDYDVIFLGYPTWGYTAPMAIFSFIEEYDLSGKTIIPFCAHGTGGLADSVRDITAALPSSTVLKPIGLYRSNLVVMQDKIREWLAILGLSL